MVRISGRGDRSKQTRGLGGFISGVCWKGHWMFDRKNMTQALEKALTEPESQRFFLSLFVAGITPRSLRAIENAEKLCDEYLKGRYELEIIDIYQQPGLAKGAQVIAVPTLVKKRPLPLQRFIGDLTDPEPILIRLAVKKEKH